MICPKNQEDEEKDLELQRVNSEYEGRIVWRSCCLKCDRDIVQFIVKYIILVGLIIFFAIQMAYVDTCEQQQTWSNLLTFVVGLAIPSPKIK
jgi:hypothetical protein